MSIFAVLAEKNPLSECQCANEPSVCNQYSTDSTCVGRLPNLASPLDETPDIIAEKYDYYSFGSEWAATYCGEKPKRHVGADLGVEFEDGKKIPVYAAASGQVKADYPCSSSYNWAKGIVIDHDGAFTTVYEHINPLVSVGQDVDKGQQIATVAKIEGYQHLHFGIKCGGYEAISTRGALPVEHGPCDKKTDCSTSGCRCDPLFPGPFIDPLDARIVYEKNNPPQETIQSQSPSRSLDLDLATIPTESALSTTPMMDSNHPTVQAFQVTPLGLTMGESFTIDYAVSDMGSSGLNRVELWRKDEKSDWKEIKRDALSGGNSPTSGSFSDAPSNSGKYWYGLHVVDNVGNWNDERNSNTDNPSASLEPIEVEIISPSTDSCKTQEAESWFDKGKTSYDQNQYHEAIQNYEEAVKICPQYAEAWCGKGDALFMLGDRDGAIQCYDEVIKIDPQYEEAWNNKGTVLHTKRNYDEAIQCYDEAIKIDSQYEEALYGKGHTLYEKGGSYEEALQCLNEAIALRPGISEFWKSKGDVLKALGSDEAQAAFDKADELENINKPSHEAKGGVSYD